MKFITIISLLLIFTLPVNSIAEDHANAEHHETEDNGFSAGDFILDHIGDAHDWHILTINDHHYSIPLPIILYSEQSGFHTLWSTKLEHGHQYKGFRLNHENGKIIEEVHGEEYLPWDFSIKKNVMAIFISLALLFWIFISVGKAYKQNPKSAPKGMQSLLEPIILFIRDDIAKEAIGERNTNVFYHFCYPFSFSFLLIICWD